MDSDLAQLCRSCALCCDGALFGRVRLAPEEVEPARRRGLRVVASGTSFEQPCAALGATGEGERACAIYGERPGACRAFTCRLYERHRRERGPLAPRLEAVRRVRELLHHLDRTRSDPVAFEELVRRLDADFARATPVSAPSSGR
jgi:Fe-S-cluster containining protein